MSLTAFATHFVCVMVGGAVGVIAMALLTVGGGR